jgi:cytochrome c oxidase cbb3-type subunit III
MSDPELPQESGNRPPVISLLLFAGVVVFLVRYIAAYTPAISGWSFYTKFEHERAASRKISTAATPGKYIGNGLAIAAGKSLFETNCAPCHKADASGGIGPDLRGKLIYGSTPDNLYETISKGRPNGMPPFGQPLGDDRICRIIAFLVSIRS